MKNTALLFVNLGSPDSTKVKDVRRYLAEFLDDPRVITLPTLIRKILLYGFILPFRPKKTAEAYQTIWDDQTGSPLITNSKAFIHKVQNLLGDTYHIELAMRYGQPSLQDALKRIQQQNINKIIVFPLYPQYASSTTGTVMEAIFNELKTWWDMPAVDVIEPYYQHPSFIQALSRVTQDALKNVEVDHVLFSFHGLPVSHIEQTEKDKDIHCDRQLPCPAINSQNRFCYRAQCYATARAVAQKMNLPENKYQVSFQSRLGRTPWIKPYTDEILPKLFDKGVKDLAVLCPAFVADCLETLEEIGIQLKQSWQALGGQNFVLIPCLNDNDNWIYAVKDIIQS